MFDYGPELYPYYAKLINNGVYDSVEEMCNALALNYDDVYDYDSYAERMDREDDEDEAPRHWRRRRR